MITGFGIKKLQITLVVEDDKVSLEELQEEIEEFEDYVQSTDIVYPVLISRTNSRLQWLNCKSQVRGQLNLFRPCRYNKMKTLLGVLGRIFHLQSQIGYPIPYSSNH